MKQLIILFAVLISATTFAQNVGIGISTPDEKLQVDSVIRIGKNSVIQQGSTRKNTIKFGDGNFATISEQDKDDRLVLNAGSFSFKNGKVGIGVDSATVKLDVAGAIKITDGTEGLGKVLTSDAAGNATWQKAAYGNTERFQFNIFKSNTNNGQLETYYNFGTATTAYTTGNQFFNLYIAKSGLYHFDVNLSHSVNADYSQKNTNPRNIKFQLLDFGFGTIYTGYSPYNYNNASLNSEASFEKSFDKYITAPAQIRFLSTTTNTGTYELNYLVTGYLISE